MQPNQEGVPVPEGLEKRVREVADWLRFNMARREAETVFEAADALAAVIKARVSARGCPTCKDSMWVCPECGRAKPDCEASGCGVAAVSADGCPEGCATDQPQVLEEFGDLRKVIDRACLAVSKGDSPEAVAAYIWSNVGPSLAAGRERTKQAESVFEEARREANREEARIEKAEAALAEIAEKCWLHPNDAPATKEQVEDTLYAAHRIALAALDSTQGGRDPLPARERERIKQTGVLSIDPDLLRAQGLPRYAERIERLLAEFDSPKEEEQKQTPDPLQALVMTPEEEAERLGPSVVRIPRGVAEIRSDEARLGILWKSGSHYVARNPDGTWGVAAKTLKGLQTMCEGEKVSGLYKMSTPDLVPDGRERPDLILRRIDDLANSDSTKGREGGEAR